ncbi:hypothetical protein SEA_BIRTHDAYBOY_43 [Gordonia phage BirthdayBoy]|uniref:Uncharacterized protein n=2 Tax=Lambovirus TaxID=2843412 RepID=A0A5J6TUI6_9CAUD|nr:hypothetical protein HWC69_gp042 [Gordonia phage Ranch]QFG12352.1 hypothetical protein PBI_RANCH_42 [Gordonia phage Ranch]WNM66036.1 hypothetical protein SEA_BIRTHDAYBOY_43 [Gordonia phage BirthdayBoy]
MHAKVEIVSIEEVSGVSPDVRCESIGCGRHATKDVILLLNGEPECGSTACDLHADSIAEELRNA